MRVKMIVAYKGTAFYGSQIQTETPQTVMGVLHEALKKLGIHTPPVASGRTDRGVHATGQVVHCDLPDYWHHKETLHDQLNRRLPPTLHICSIHPVEDEFHARFGATRRIYRYLLSEQEPNPFEDDLVTFSDPINLPLMQEAIRHFVGEHDFAYFHKTGSDPHTTVRTIYRAFAYRHKGYVIFTFEGNSFLRSQVRLMVGWLLAINRGTHSVETLIQQLQQEQHHHLKPAPSNGLYLARIGY